MMGGDTEGQIRLPYIGIYEKFSSKLFIRKGNDSPQKRITPLPNDTPNRSYSFNTKMDT